MPKSFESKIRGSLRAWVGLAFGGCQNYEYFWAAPIISVAELGGLYWGPSIKELRFMWDMINSIDSGAVFTG